MRIALGLLVAVLAVCQISADVPIDREYRYDYRARTASGILGDVKQLSGLGLAGTITIQNKGDSYYFKFSDLKKGVFNQRVSDKDFEGEIPIEYRSYFANETAYVESINKPFRVTFEKGLVKTFDYTPEDPEWSLSIKRAIASLFQLNFDRVNPVESSKSNYLKHDDNENFYITMEDGIGGECETGYSIQNRPYRKRPYERVLNVTKVRTYEHCKGQRPIVFHSTHLGEKCEDCKQVEPFNVLSTTEYQIHGDRHHAVIEKISNTGSYLFTPFGPESFTAWSGVNQTLRLVSRTRINEPIVFPSEYKTTTSLQYTYEADGHHQETDHVDLHEANHYRQHYYDFNTYKEKARTNLAFLAQEYDVLQDLEEKNYPQRFAYLVSNIGSMSFDEIKEFYKTFLNYNFKSASSVEKRQKMAFWDTLAVAGTNPTISFIIYAIKEKYLPAEVAPYFFDNMAIHVKDHSESLLDHFLEYTETIDKDTKKSHFKGFWLTFGSLVNRGCHYDKDDDNTFNPEEHHIRPEKCTKYVDVVYNHFEQAKTAWEKTLYMKTIGNTGLPELYKRLRPIVTGERPFSPEIRDAALIAFYRLQSEVSRMEFLTVLVPLFHNHSEPIALRLLAFELLMLKNPSYSIVQQMGDNLRHEPNRQVASYVYSAFKSLANSTNPCNKLIGEKTKRALQNMPEYFYGYQYAQKLLSGYFNDKYHYGSEMQLSYIGANDSFIPEYVYLEKSVNLLGRNFIPFAIDFHGHGFSRLYDQLFGKDGQNDPHDESKSLLNLVRRHPRDVNTYDKEMDEYRTTLNQVNREPNPIYGSLKFTLFDQEIKYLEFDEREMPSYAQDGYFYLPKELPKMLKEGKKINKLKLSMRGDAFYELPNEMGLPLKLSWQYPAYGAVKGDIKLDVQPAFFPEDRDFKKPTNIKLAVNLQPVFHAKGIAHIQVITPLISYGMGVHNDIAMKYALNVETDYDIKEKKFHINYKPTQSTYDLFNVRTYPFTFIDHRNNFVSPADEAWVKPVHYKENPTKLEGHIGQDYFGVGLSHEEQNEYAWNNFASFYKFVGSFFTRTSRTFESFNYANKNVQRILPGLGAIRDFLFLSPQIIPVDMKIKYEPSKEDPTKEFDLTVDIEKYVKTETQNPLPPVTEEKIVDEDPTFRKFWSIKADLIAKGNTDKKYRLNLSTSRDYFQQMREVDIEYERTPIPSYDTEPFKLCAHGRGKMPEFDQWYSFDEQIEKKVEGSWDIRFGKNCDSDSKIEIKGVAERTDAQKKRDAEHSYPAYKACQEDIKNGYKLTSDTCWDAFMEYYTIKKFTVDIHYENLPESFKAFFNNLNYWTRYYWFLNIVKMEKNVSNPPNHIRISSNYSIDEPARMDYEIQTPDRNILYKDIYYPHYFPSMQFPHLRMDGQELRLGEIFNWGYAPWCAHEKDAFVTFDGVRYNFQAPVNNYYVLTKDCSKNEKFLVLIKDLEHSTIKKALKVFILGTKIEILPLDATSPLVVRVNDVVKPVKDESVLLEPDTKRPGQMLLKIVHTGPQWVIDSERAGLMVVYDGIDVAVEISNEYRGKLCGLCGNLDGEATREFVGPTGCVYNNAQAFGHSYLINKKKYSGDDTCTYPYAPKRFAKCTFERNQVLHGVTLPGAPPKVKSVCFTNAPVTECAPGCKVVNDKYVRKTVGFHCVNTGDVSTGEMLTRHNKLQPLPELENKSNDYSDTIEYPEECVRA